MDYYMSFMSQTQQLITYKGSSAKRTGVLRDMCPYDGEDAYLWRIGYDSTDDPKLLANRFESGGALIGGELVTCERSTEITESLDAPMDSCRRWGRALADATARMVSRSVRPRAVSRALTIEGF